jgi:hypothetical protein
MWWSAANAPCGIPHGPRTAGPLYHEGCVSRALAMREAQGRAWRVHRDEEPSAEAPLLCSSWNTIRPVDRDALNIHTRRAEQ